MVAEVSGVSASSTRLEDVLLPGSAAARSLESVFSLTQTAHQLIPLRNVEGIKWKNGMQQRYAMCNSHTTWVCGDCSTGPTCLVPLCPEATRPRKGNDRGKTIYHPCHGKHQCWPTYFPKGKREKGATSVRATLAGPTWLARTTRTTRRWTRTTWTTTTTVSDSCGFSTAGQWSVCV